MPSDVVLANFEAWRILKRIKKLKKEMGFFSTATLFNIQKLFVFQSDISETIGTENWGKEYFVKVGPHTEAEARKVALKARDLLCMFPLKNFADTGTRTHDLSILFVVG